MISINPGDVRSFGAKRDSHFYLVTNSKVVDKINIINDGSYLSYNKIIFDSDDDATVETLKGSFIQILQNKIPVKSHILVIAPNNYFRPPPHEFIGPTRKILILPCNSTPTDLDIINKFWEIIINTDPKSQEEKAKYFFETAEKADYLEFVDYKNKTASIFKHMHEDYVWNEQGGFLNGGDQLLAPAGEINVFNLPVQEFDEHLRLDFNGTLAFHGTPIVHSGTPSFSYRDQKRIYDLLSYLIDHPIIAHVKDGEIIDLSVRTKEGEIACNMLQSLFNVDSRYRILLEIGFGINTQSKIIKGNHAMNETFGGTNGVAHFGLGIIPFTQYHIDIICPNLKVLTNKGDLLIGSNETSFHMNRKKVSGCVCLDG